MKSIRSRFFMIPDVIVNIFRDGTYMLKKRNEVTLKMVRLQYQINLELILV
jgi:hypothetical protein